MRRVLAMLLCIALVLIFLPANAFAATEIKNLSITMELPDPGKDPISTAVCGQGYRIHGIDWLDRSTNEFLEAGEKIQGGRKYYAYLWVEADDGYQFASINDSTPDVNVTINGAACTASKAYEYIAPAMVYVAYPITIPTIGWIRSVDLTISAPKVGEKPSYPKFEHTTYKFTNMVALPEYVNGINWVNLATSSNIDPNAPFQTGVQYGVHITIEQKSGYAFVPQPEAKVNGQVASAQLDYGSVLLVNATFPTLEDTHTHFYTDWAWNSGQHYKNCTDCDEVFFAESHKGGVATCQQDGKCTVCGYAYIKAGEEYHIPDTSKWVARGDMYHYHPCKRCGAHCDTEDHRWSPSYLYKDATGHAWICADCKANSAVEKHNPGAAATETTPQTCKDCGYIIEPAKNHTHDLTKVPQTPATCTEEGNIEYYFCTGCNDCFADGEGKNKIPETMSVKVGALGHTVSDHWGTDEIFHWRVCSVCDLVLEETKMQHDGTDGKCTTCGFDGSAAPTAPSEPDKTDAPNDTPWLTILLVALVCFAAAMTATVIALKMKKKKGESS